MNNPKKAVLLFADGSFFEGKAAGATGTATGEICFNTGMSGYQEIFTDPSYHRQIVVTTHTHIGNYGVLPVESESGTVKISGLVCKNFSEIFSRHNAEFSLNDWFELQKIVAIYGVDTRAMVRRIRSKGAMNAIISNEIFDPKELARLLNQAPNMEGLELASEVSTPTPYRFGNIDARFRVAVMDYGVKSNILHSLARRDCYLQVFPAKTPFEEVAKFEPDGFFLSNGPGDPAAMPYAVETAQKMLETNKPMFGICLGHQLIAQASGLKTYKMPFGHRGLNHPIKNLETGLAEITSQNHGFAVEKFSETENKTVKITHLHLNDGSVAGIRRTDKPVFSVQYHPESNPGPHDSRYLFDQFVSLMKEAAKR